MSALGQKQTCAMQNVMSALPPIADMCSALAHVRFVPIADMGHHGFNRTVARNGGSPLTTRQPLSSIRVIATRARHALVRHQYRHRH